MAEVNIDKTALREAVALGQKIGVPITSEAIHYALIPEGTKVESLINLQHPHGLRPDRIKQAVALKDADSFVSYVKLFTDKRTRIFADPASTSFMAVMDYHEAEKQHPEFLSHRAALKLEFDERWVLWSGKNEKIFQQADFAEFIEDNISDIYNPSGAEMLETARDLRARTDVNFESKITPKNGQVQLTYHETVNAGISKGNMEVPEFFTIKIPVFFGEEPVVIQARLRFRVNGGALTFHYKLQRKTEILNDAFNFAKDSIADGLQAKVLLGALSVS